MTKIIFKCEICRQVYILSERPSNCPFCGSFEEHVKPVEDVPYIREYELTEKSKDNIFKAIEKEFYAYSYYECSNKISIDKNIINKFKVMGMHEIWHHRLLSDELNLKFDETIIELKCTNLDEENRRNAMIAEAQAIVDYKKYLEEATEPRVKMVFAALLEVEQMHLDLIS